MFVVNAWDPEAIRTYERIFADFVPQWKSFFENAQKVQAETFGLIVINNFANIIVYWYGKFSHTLPLLYYHTKMFVPKKCWSFSENY